MAPYPQHTYKLNVDNSSGTPTAMESGLLEFTPPGVEQNVGVHHTVGSDAQQATVGGYMLSDITIKVRFEKETSTAWDLLNALATGSYATRSADRTITWDTPDSTTGSRRNALEAKIKSFKPDTLKGGSGDPQTWVAVFTPNGAITASIIA